MDGGLGLSATEFSATELSAMDGSSGSPGSPGSPEARSGAGNRHTFDTTRIRCAAIRDDRIGKASGC